MMPLSSNLCLTLKTFRHKLADFKLELAGETLALCPEKAVFWPSERTLLVSDAHFGKVAHFRKNGLAIPGTAALDNFNVLQQICLRHEVEKILFLGDLFHSTENLDVELLARWRNSNPHIALQLVVGNHDIIKPALLQEFGIHILGHELLMAPFYFTHKPANEIPEGYYNLCGHIHPGVKLRLKSVEYLKLPVFYFSERVGILPAFGVFTGLHPVQAKAGDKLYAVAENSIIELGAIV
jgi:DNA ligase-associated metallophosphoesterase